MEDIYSETYSLLIEKYIKDSDEKYGMRNAIQYNPCIKKKSDRAVKWIGNKSSSFATRLESFAIVEGFLLVLVSPIFWIKKKKISPGLCLIMNIFHAMNHYT